MYADDIKHQYLTFFTWTNVRLKVGRLKSDTSFWQAQTPNPAGSNTRTPYQHRTKQTLAP
jgi:hypothetical protein